MKCEIKALQMDLARQKENIPQIKEIIDLAARYGYNTLFLYLEDRIKTKTYHYRSDEESYLPEEIKEIVSYAESKEIEMIPIVPNLGHTERFLENKELAHLAELNGNIEGRFTLEGEAGYKVICPSREESYTFFDEYLKEIAALFPSGYFHAGLDESFDVGFCEICRKRHKKEGFGGIFLKHILHTHELLKSLGKTMLMWDDMIEFAPAIIEEIPRDIIICTWNYRFIKKYPMAQFCNNKTWDVFKEYEELGFRYIAATGANNILNVKTFTEYAEKHNPFGMLNTIWERKPSPLTDLYVNIVYGGMLWNDKLKGLNVVEGVEKAAAEIPGVSAIPAAAIVGSFDNVDRNYFTTVSGNYREEEESFAVNTYLMQQINENLKTLSGEEYDIARATAFKTEKAILLYKIRQAALKIYNYRTGVAEIDKGEVEKLLNECRKDAEKMLEFQLSIWKLKRGNLSGAGEECSKILNNISLLEEALNEAEYGDTGRLDVSFCLPDEYGGPRCEIYVEYDDGEELAAKGTIKFLSSEKAYYTLSFPINADKAVRKCRIEVFGFGGQGFTYVEAKTRAGEFTPKAITDVRGEVEHPCNILKSDLQWCWLGNTDMKYTIDNPTHSKLKNVIEVAF